LLVISEFETPNVNGKFHQQFQGSHKFWGKCKLQDVIGKPDMTLPNSVEESIVSMLDLRQQHLLEKQQLLKTLRMYPRKVNSVMLMLKNNSSY
jgi:hypothetical protein